MTLLIAPQKQEVLNNIPHPYEMIYALKNSNMAISDCLNELIDNSIDANATKINISYEIVNKEDNLIKIIIADNGEGMNINELSEAMVLGSKVQRKAGSLGHFGVGLIVSAFNLGRELRVITRKDEACFFSAISLNRMKDTGKWAKTFGAASSEDLKLLKEGNGTVVIIERNWDCINTFKSAIDNYSKDVSRRYYKKLNGSLEISISTPEKTTIISKGKDPFDVLNSTLLFSKELKLPIQIPGEKKEEVSIRFKGYLLSETSNVSPAPSLLTQGFYIYRNEREITNGGFLNLYSLHNDFNRFRIQVLLDDNSHRAFKIAANKISANLVNEESINIVKEFIKPYLEKVREEVNSSQKITKVDKKREKLDKDLALMFRKLTLDTIEVEKITKLTTVNGIKETKDRKNSKRSKSKSSNPTFPANKGFIIKFVGVVDKSNKWQYSCELNENLLTIKINQADPAVIYYLDNFNREEAFKRNIILEYISFYNLEESLNYESYMDKKTELENALSKN